jgi:hypothetical protein
MSKYTLIRIGLAGALVALGLGSTQVARACPHCPGGDPMTSCFGSTGWGAQHTVCGGDGWVEGIGPGTTTSAEIFAGLNRSSGPVVNFCTDAQGTFGGNPSNGCMAEETVQGESMPNQTPDCNGDNGISYLVESCSE